MPLGSPASAAFYAAGPPADVLTLEILREVYGKDLVITEKDLIIVEDYHHHH